MRKNGARQKGDAEKQLDRCMEGATNSPKHSCTQGSSKSKSVKWHSMARNLSKMWSKLGESVLWLQEAKGP